jgi:hypothetical protein
MEFKQFIQITGISTAIAWTVWLFLIFSIDPVYATMFEFGMFYLSLLVAITGTVSGLTVAMRVKFRPETILFRHVVVSFRQAVLIGVLAVLSMIFLSKGLLNIWSSLALILILSIVEFLIQSMNKRDFTNEHKKSSE